MFYIIFIQVSPIVKFWFWIPYKNMNNVNDSTVCNEVKMAVYYMHTWYGGLVTLLSANWYHNCFAIFPNLGTLTDNMFIQRASSFRPFLVIFIWKMTRNLMWVFEDSFRFKSKYIKHCSNFEKIHDNEFECKNESENLIFEFFSIISSFGIGKAKAKPNHF